MHHTHEKGTQVDHAQLNTQKRFPESGLVIVLRGLLRGPQGAALYAVSRLRAWRPLVALLLIALAVTLASGTSTALASAPPSLQFAGTNAIKAYGNYGNDAIYVFSTRLYSAALLSVNELDTKWRAEYSTSKAALEGGSGTIAGSGEEPGSHVDGEGEDLTFGTPTGQVIGGNAHQLHHLVPETHYYAQFVAENSAGRTVLPFEFTTSPVEAPEVGRQSETGGDDTPDLYARVSSPTEVSFTGILETNGAATKYSIGYSTSPSGPVTVCATGSISVAEDYAEPDVVCTGLAPETTYYPHLTLTNEKGTREQTTTVGPGGGEISTFTTPTAKPVAGTPEVRNVTADSAHVIADVNPNHEETRWRFEYATSMIGPWTIVPGGAGSISQAEAEAGSPNVGTTVTGLSPAGTYYVRLFAESAVGEGENGFGEPISTETRGFASFETAGPPTATTLAMHAVDGESLRIIGAVDPNSNPTSAEQTVTIEGAPTGGTFTLTFDGQTTVPIAYHTIGNSTVEGVQKALDNLSLPGAPRFEVEGPASGPYTIYFGGAGNGFGQENPLVGKSQPAIEAHAAGLSPSGAVTVAITQQGGVAYDAHYHFQYVSEEQFKNEGEWANAASTPEVDAGSGSEVKFGGADLPTLTSGETYRYRIVATSSSPGNPVVDGAEHALVVPVAPAPDRSASCPNETLRTGASASLPDCRAYEQLTPVDKEGAREPFNYGFGVGGGVLIGKEGDHVTLEAPEVSWGAGPAAGEDPYFFSREAGNGWRMTAASNQPETGVDKPETQLFAPDLTSFAFLSSFQTSDTSASKEIEYKTGPPGGPYTTVASVPRSDIKGENSETSNAWVASSADFSKLVLASEDHTLLEGVPTGTKEGADLYEYSGGELRQVNVSGSGATIGACGATIAKGNEAAGEVSSAHAVSSDGSRVFFEAAPGSNCSEPKHLYMRVDHENTVDLGASQFIAANSEGTKLLLEKRSGTREILLYETESASLKSLFVLGARAAAGSTSLFNVSEDLSAIYFVSPDQLTPEAQSIASGEATSLYLYRYDVSAEKLTFIDLGDKNMLLAQVSPDGRYLYFSAEAVGGVPGGLGEEAKHGFSQQVYRYDSSESLIQCMSCASPFDPEPKLTAVFGETGGTGGMLASKTGSPRSEFASSNGDYVFFDTPSALLPSDVDGEVAPERGSEGEGEITENKSYSFSVSSDVYEWRKSGVDGCVHLQGCLALITNGRGGFLNLFLGTDESGQDAFFYTNSELLPQDDDTAGDIYDARIGGGTPPAPPRPVECEGDACAAQANPPNDATPSSFTFSGAGNLSPVATPTPNTKAKPKKKVVKKKPKKKKGKKVGRKAKKSAKGRK